jgi:hypothetical protein
MTFFRASTCRHGLGRWDLARRMPREESRTPRWPVSVVVRRRKMARPGWESFVKYLEGVQKQNESYIGRGRKGRGKGGLHDILFNQMKSTRQCVEFKIIKVQI